MTAHQHSPVVITRPLAQAEPLARRIAAIGRDAVVFPLLEIHPLADQSRLHATMQALDRYALVAFVSPNAIDAAFMHLDRWPAGVPIAVMGEGSRAALLRHGKTTDDATIISTIDPNRTDSQTLLDVLDLEALKGRDVLIIRGETGRELLADALRERGGHVEQLPAYRRVAPVLDQAGRERLLSLLDRSCEWVITSSEALRILVQLTRDAAHDAGVVKLQQQHLLVPHVRIAETAKALGFIDILQTASGDEPLIAALQSRA